jgi:hypothetical protein
MDETASRQLTIPTLGSYPTNMPATPSFPIT